MVLVSHISAHLISKPGDQLVQLMLVSSAIGRMFYQEPAWSKTSVKPALNEHNKIYYNYVVLQFIKYLYCHICYSKQMFIC